MAETAVKEKANGIPVPEEGTEEFARMNKMAKIAIPIVLIISPWACCSSRLSA